MTDYTSIPALAQVVLEESWVLGVEARPSTLIIQLDFVVTADHPLYRAPLVNETYGLVRGALSFEAVTRLEWMDQGTPPAIDLDGESVYGNLDVLTVEANNFALSGDFGAIRLTADNVRVSYDANE